MICPRCSVADVSPLTGACELCGYVPGGAVAVDHPDATDELARRELAHQFRIDVLLGQGDASAVYLARELDSDQYVVLKVKPRPTDRRDVDDRFREAVAVVGALNHPHLVSIRRHGATDSLFWYSCDRVRGRSLRNVLRTGGPMSLTATLRLVTQVAGVLDYAHRRGIVHGTLKPENVLLDNDGWVHVCDTMVSRILHQPARPEAPGDPGRARSSVADDPARRPSPADGGAGEPTDADRPADDAAAPPVAPAPRSPYQAPEDDLVGTLTPAADQYALATLVRECLGPAAELPIHVQHALRRAQAVRPIDRFPEVLDFLAAMESRSLTMPDARPAGRSSSSTPVLTIPDWKPLPKQRSGIVRWSLVAGAVALTAYGAWRVAEHQRANRWEVLPVLGPPPARVDSARLAADSAAADSAAALARQPRSRRTPRPAATTADAPTAAAPARTDAPRTPPATRTPAAAAEAPATGAPGRLFISATPWGQLYLDGQLVGNTPKANLSVPAGSHTVRIVRDGFETWERTVQVGAGQDVRLTDIQLVERRP